MTTMTNTLNTRVAFKLETHCLEAQSVERLSDIRPGDTVLSGGGLMWVTQEGDPQDYMLQQGEAFIASRQGVVVIEALREATYRLLRG
jgi:hypothetical protein